MEVESTSSRYAFSRPSRNKQDLEACPLVCCQLWVTTLDMGYSWYRYDFKIEQAQSACAGLSNKTFLLDKIEKDPRNLFDTSSLLELIPFFHTEIYTKTGIRFEIGQTTRIHTWLHFVFLSSSRDFYCRSVKSWLLVAKGFVCAAGGRFIGVVYNMFLPHLSFRSRAVSLLLLLVLRYAAFRVVIVQLCCFACSA